MNQLKNPHQISVSSKSLDKMYPIEYAKDHYRKWFDKLKDRNAAPELVFVFDGFRWVSVFHT